MEDYISNKQDYLDFCLNMKKEFGLNINPNDEFFPLIYKLITLNTQNSEIINQVKNVLETSIKQISDTNNNLYNNQYTLLEKNEQLLKKQENALSKLYPKKHISLNTPEVVKSYWKEKTKFIYVMLLSVMSLLIIATISVISINESWQIQRYLKNANIEYNDKGEKFLLLEKSDNINNAVIGNYIEWKDDNIAIPLKK